MTDGRRQRMGVSRLVFICSAVALALGLVVAMLSQRASRQITFVGWTNIDGQTQGRWVIPKPIEFDPNSVWNRLWSQYIAVDIQFEASKSVGESRKGSVGGVWNRNSSSPIEINWPVFPGEKSLTLKNIEVTVGVRGNTKIEALSKLRRWRYDSTTLDIPTNAITPPEKPRAPGDDWFTKRVRIP